MGPSSAARQRRAALLAGTERACYSQGVSEMLADGQYVRKRCDAATSVGDGERRRRTVGRRGRQGRAHTTTALILRGRRFRKTPTRGSCDDGVCSRCAVPCMSPYTLSVIGVSKQQPCAVTRAPPRPHGTSLPVRQFCLRRAQDIDRAMPCWPLSHSSLRTRAH